MPWIIGIDEAGYGPNLGPLVMTSVAFRIPADLAGTDLWEVLKAAVRRHSETDDGRILIDDSKLVYSPDGGLADLETAVLALLAQYNGQSLRLDDCIDRLCPDWHDDLRLEPWFTGASPLPVQADATAVCAAARRFDQVCAEQQIALGLVRSEVVCPSRFNRLLDKWDSKAAILGEALAGLLQMHLQRNDDAEPLWFFVDKHGGRNQYAAMLQDALGEGMVVAGQEGRNRSVYRVLGLKREVCLTFQPRADAEHFCVALASMASKYLREVLMLEFNRFWQAQVPGLKPTAGYPVDAARFVADIRPAVASLKIAETALWRRK